MPEKQGLLLQELKGDRYSVENTSEPTPSTGLHTASGWLLLLMPAGCQQLPLKGLLFHNDS